VNSGPGGGSPAGGSPSSHLTVGLLDSGVGGLSVLRAMLGISTPPWARIIYLADLAHFPYGPRPASEVRRLALAGVNFLARQGSDFVAVACNTASASGVRPGEAQTPVPVLDIIGPGARYAASVARAEGSGQVLVLGTEGTIRSRVWDRVLAGSGWHGLVTGWACPLLANIIEEGQNGLVARRAVAQATRGLALQLHSTSRARPDLVVLGCTHYPFAADAFEETLSRVLPGRPLHLVDPSRALADELAAVLGARQRVSGAEGARQRVSGAGGIGGSAGERARVPPEVRFFTTGRKEHFRERAAKLLAGELAKGAGRLRLDDVVEVSLAESPPEGSCPDDE